MTDKQANYNYTQYLLEASRPIKNIKLSDWSDQKRILPKVGSPEPGRWRTSRTPYLAQIMNDLSPDSPIREVVLMKGTQIGGTEILLNWLACTIDMDPAPFLLVQPTVEVAKRWSKQRFAPMILEMDCLRAKIRDRNAKDSNNNILTKEFPGGIVIITGANSAVGLRSMPMQNLAFDEVDGFPEDCDGEGDPVDLAKKRSSNFANRKQIMVSSPTLAGLSRIEREFENTCQFYYWVPCPFCGSLQDITWKKIKWEKNKPKTARMECEHCFEMIEEFHKTKMLAAGEWVAKYPERIGKKVGYHISALYSPLGWKSWEECVDDFLSAQGDTTKLKTFVNTILGEVWEEEGEQLSWELIAGRREKYAHPVPKEVLVITGAVDVQKDRLELDVVGWGHNEESWRLYFNVLMGDPTEPYVWEQLDQDLLEIYDREDGVPLKISCACIDSGAFTKQVYEFTSPRETRRIFSIKGSGEQGKPIISRPSRNNKSKTILYSIGTDTAKETIYSYLKRVESGPGFCHFPESYDDEFFKQLTAEKIVIKKRKGFAHREWIKVRNRNEALDLAVYNLAALAILNPNFNKLDENLDAKAQRIEDSKKPEENKQETFLQQARKKRKSGGRRGGFARRF